PLAFLLGKARLEKQMQGRSLAPDQTALVPGNMVLRGLPTNLTDRVSQVLLEVTPDNRIVRIQMDEVDVSVTEYRFDQQRENVQIADQQFRFTVPAGVELIEGDFGQ